MKRSSFVIFVWVTLAMAIVVIWMISPAKPVAVTAKDSIVQPQAPKVALAAPAASRSEANIKIELPKTASAMPTGNPIDSKPANPLASVDVAAEREAHRRAVEQMIIDVGRSQQKLIDDSATSEEKETNVKHTAELMQMYQDRLNELAGPPPEPVDFGNIALNDGVSVEKTLANGEVFILTPKIGADGKWTINLTDRRAPNGNGDITTGTAKIRVTPGQFVKVPGDDEQYYFFTPQLISILSADPAEAPTP